MTRVAGPGDPGLRPMRVLMLSDVALPRVNGVSTSIDVTRRQLHALGLQTRLIAPDYAPHQDQPGDPGTVRVAGRRLPFDPEDRLMHRADLLKAARRVVEQGCDLVHVHTPFQAHAVGVRLAREARLPLVETFHTHFEDYAEQYLRFLPRRWLRFATRRFSARQAAVVDALVVPSTAMIEVLQGYGIDRPMHLIPTGIEMQGFAGGDGQAFRARLGIPPDHALLLHVGRVAREKNIEFLIQAMVRIRRHRPKVTLLLAGDGPARRELQGLVRALALESHVRFLGYLDRDGELQSCYRAADAFVFASRTETQGLVLLEAMACGTPVVSLARMGTRDLLLQGRGAIVSEDDPGKFADATLNLLSDPALRRRLSTEARALATTYTAKRQARALAGLYAELVDAAPGAGRSRAA